MDVLHLYRITAGHALCAVIVHEYNLFKPWQYGFVACVSPRVVVNHISNLVLVHVLLELLWLSASTCRASAWCALTFVVCITCSDWQDSVEGTSLNSGSEALSLKTLRLCMR